MENLLQCSLADIKKDDNLLLIVVESHTDTLKEFYALLKKALNLPDYFSNNLDSLDEVLCDLSWISQTTIHLHFININKFLKKDTKREVVFEVLRNAEKHWKEDGSKAFVLSAEKLKNEYLHQEN